MFLLLAKSMTDRILIVEDDLDIANLIRVNLVELGIAIQHESDGEKALNLALTQSYALIILDVMLPTMNGLDICRMVRNERPLQNIIMLTSKTSETDRVLGLELGADDYMTKPFSVRELQARVRAQLRKYHELCQSQTASLKPLSTLNIGRLRINQVNHQVFFAEQELDLTVTEFELLHHLARHPGQVFSRTQLLESVWGYHHSGYEHTVNSHINRLRAKLESDATSPKIVQTVWGVGYKFNPAGVSG